MRNSKLIILKYKLITLHIDVPRALYYLVSLGIQLEVANSFIRGVLAFDPIPR